MYNWIIKQPKYIVNNTYNWATRVESEVGLRKYSLTFRFNDKTSFEIDRYIEINMLDGSYEFKFKVDTDKFFGAFDDSCRILTNLIKILDNLDIDSFIEEVINDNKEMTNSNLSQWFINKYISQPNRITSIRDCENGGHWAYGSKFFIFTVDNKYVYHFESYDSGAYTNNHVDTLRCFNEITRESDGNYSYTSPIIKEIDVNNVGLEVTNRWGHVNIVGGKIDIDKLISQSK